MSRLLLVGPVAPPEGGVATHVRELARAAAVCGAAVEVVDPRRLGPDGDGRPRLLWALGRAAARGDLVHVHTNGHNQKSWVLAALCSSGRLAGRPALLTLHSGFAAEYIARHPRTARGVAARFSTVIAVNALIAHELARAGVPHERIVIAPAFTPASLAFRLPPNGLQQLRRRHPQLLCAMALGDAPEYGADVLLDAFALVHARLPRAGLALYGEGTRTPRFAAEVAHRGLHGAVHLLGPLGRERALALLAACDLFVRPTRADGDAVSVREALALGTPVVASEVGARPPGIALFPVEDAAACAEKIFSVLGSPEAYRGPASAPTSDCLPALLALYERSGLFRLPVTTGTGLAML